MMDLDKLKALEARATKAPWEDYSEPEVNMPSTLMYIARRDGPIPIRHMLEPLEPKDVAFISEIRNAAPALFEEIERLCAENERLKRHLIESHMDEPEDDPPYCDSCNNTGEIDCHCGGDLCVCGRQEIPCPDCRD